MKIKSFIALAFAGILSISTFAKSPILSGNSNTDLGKYTISVSNEDFEVKGNKLKTYLLDYENGGQPVYISLDHSENCRIFIVRSKFFEIQYKCKKDKFGVSYLQAKYTTIDPLVNINRIDKNKFAQQRIITKTNKTDEELMGLIASYFPNLLNETYKKALN